MCVCVQFRLRDYCSTQSKLDSHFWVICYWSKVSATLINKVCVSLLFPCTQFPLLSQPPWSWSLENPPLTTPHNLHVSAWVLYKHAPGWAHVPASTRSTAHIISGQWEKTQAAVKTNYVKGLSSKVTTSGWLTEEKYTHFFKISLLLNLFINWCHFTLHSPVTSGQLKCSAGGKSVTVSFTHK